MLFLKRHPCVDCGEPDPVVLQFDHVRGSKAREVSLLVSDPASLSTVKEEIKKCKVRCANCHTKTARRGGWYRYRKTRV